MSALAVRDAHDVAVAEARSKLAEVETIPDAVDAIGYAETLRVAAKKARLGMRAANAAAEVRIRAERRAGELLREMPKHAGGDPSGTRSHDATGSEQPLKLSDLGVTKWQSFRWQQVARVPEEMLESYISGKKRDGLEIVTAGLLDRARLARERAETPLRYGTARLGAMKQAAEYATNARAKGGDVVWSPLEHADRFGARGGFVTPERAAALEAAAATGPVALTAEQVVARAEAEAARLRRVEARETLRGLAEALYSVGSAIFSQPVDELGDFCIPEGLVERLRLILVDVEHAAEEEARSGSSPR